MRLKSNIFKQKFSPQFFIIIELCRLANDLYSISTTIPETWTTIGYYCLKKKTTGAKNLNVGENVKCFIDNVSFLTSVFSIIA